MISAELIYSQFDKDMRGLIDYSIGYLEGIERGKTQFFGQLGLSVIAMLKEYVDANARVNPEMLHHVYEWERTGSPSARLFDINYTISNLGLSFRSTFSQSKSIKDGSREPFYDKARIMEQGIPVTIRPKNAKVLAFDVDGVTVFTPNEVTVANPGGSEVQGGFQRTFDSFFERYFTQAFMRSSGLLDYLQSPVLYQKNLKAGLRGGKTTGIETGYRWIVNAGLRND
jgi:hypothetical protein